MNRNLDRGIVCTKHENNKSKQFFVTSLVLIIVNLFIVGCEADVGLVSDIMQKNETTVNLTTVNLTTKDVFDTNEFQMVSDSIRIGIDMYAIEVDGKEVAYMETKEQAEDVLEKLKGKYKSNEMIEDRILFKEDVKIVKVKRDIFDFNDYKTEDEVIEQIVKGKKKLKTHKVAAGEYLGSIENKYGLEYGAILDANPNLDIRKLSVGTKINLIVVEPIINVVVIRRLERIEPIPYERAPNIETDKYFIGEFHLKQEGVDGEVKNILDVYWENGKKTGEIVLESTILKEPIDKVIYRGIKPRSTDNKN